MKKRRLSKFGKLSVICLVGLIIFLGVWVLLDPDWPAAQNREKRIRELVPIGMDIDKAIELLRSEGFSVGDKHFATVDKDYYWANIQIRFLFSLRDIVNMTRHKGKVNKRWVVLEAGLDGKIRKIL